MIDTHIDRPTHRKTRIDIHIHIDIHIDIHTYMHTHIHAHTHTQVPELNPSEPPRNDGGAPLNVGTIPIYHDITTSHCIV